RLAVGGDRLHQSRRTRVDAPEDVAVADAQRKRHRRAVGESAEPDSLAIHAAPLLDLQHCELEELEIRIPVAENRAPRPTPRFGGEDNDAEFVRKVAIGLRHIARPPAPWSQTRSGDGWP